MNHARDDHHQAGFTLVEILVVLAITAIVFGLSAFSLSALKNRTSPETLAAQTVRLLNHVQQAAMERQCPTAATIDMKNKIVSRNFDDPIRFPDTFKLVVTVGRETVSDRARLEVQFLPDGTSSGVELSVSDSAGQTARLETNWFTGLTRQVRAGK
jgi:general secretion pathway protein H